MYVYFISDINLREQSIIQEFIANPFLIDGHKFCIGVSVGFSSAKPLRAYITNSTWTFRFTNKPYENISANDPGTYITDGNEFGVKHLSQARMMITFIKEAQFIYCGGFCVNMTISVFETSITEWFSFKIIIKW